MPTNNIAYIYYIIFNFIKCEKNLDLNHIGDGERHIDKVIYMF